MANHQSEEILPKETRRKRNFSGPPPQMLHTKQVEDRAYLHDLGLSGRETFRGDSFLEAAREKLDFAFQPIVNIHTGVCYGHEALLRNQQTLGFDTVHAFFDYAFKNRILHSVDLLLRDKAFGKFSRFASTTDAKIFFNLDNRILSSTDYQPSQTDLILSNYGLPPTSVCLEISELHDATSGDTMGKILNSYRNKSFLLAIDDFGTGYSGLKLLHEHAPDLIKVDRYFINGIADDHKKMLFVSTIVNLSSILGITVVAEGVETERDFLACKEIGCDLAQGYYVARPTVRVEDLRPRYDKISELSQRDRRNRGSDQELILEQIEPVEPLRVTNSMLDVFEAFRKNKDTTFFPVTDESNHPLGIMREWHLKDYIYSAFGKELISNKAFGKSLRHFISRCPVADINTEAEKILGMYSLGGEPEGIIITDQFVYVGFLSAACLLKIINEKNLAIARDQNPLTKLPGNNSIIDYVFTACGNENEERTFVYFDFDNFKPFNDTYGFRQGDRALLLFSELMRKRLLAPNIFLGHVGGDDFFAGFHQEKLESVKSRIAEILECFRHEVESFYDPEARDRGYITAKNREGKPRKHPLLTCSAAVAQLPANVREYQPDKLITVIARLKKAAKESPDKMSVETLRQEEAT